MSPWSLPQKLSWDSNPSWNLSPVLMFLRICWPLCPAWAAAWETPLYACLYLTMTVPSWFSPFPRGFNLSFQPPQCRWFVFYQKSPWCGNLGERGGGEGLFPHWHLLSFFSCFHAPFHVILSQTGVVITCQPTPGMCRPHDWSTWLWIYHWAPASLKPPADLWARWWCPGIQHIT